MPSKDPEQPLRRCDVVIVLGAAVQRGGRPGPALRRRTIRGVDLVKRGHADCLLVTGGLGKFPPSEASVMRRLAMQRGLGADRILTEENGRSTFENVRQCVSIMRERGWSRAIVVSDAYHLPRALFVFRAFGIGVIGSPTKGGKYANPVWKLWHYTLREFFAFVCYGVRVLRMRIYH
jgi:uncharacterized SAM-binding protein YcdF (DUF218 family)